VTCEILELEELAAAVSDTQIVAAAIVSLREEFRGLGCHVAVDWHDAVMVAKQLEISYLAIYESILEQARSFVR
jgi:hypothetical protein